MKKVGKFPLLVFFLLSLGLSLCIGRYPIGLRGIGQILFSSLGIEGVLAPPSQDILLIFWNVRLPRIIMSFAVGCGISIAGAVFQALFRNPLAAPEILGVTAGACFGAAHGHHVFCRHDSGHPGQCLHLWNHCRISGLPAILAQLG